LKTIDFSLGGMLNESMTAIDIKRKEDQPRSEIAKVLTRSVRYVKVRQLRKTNV